MNKIVAVNFHGSELYGVKFGRVTLIAVKPIVAGMGLAWNGQLERIKRDPVLQEGMRVIRIPSKSGLQETICLPLNLIHGWLFTINSIRIRDMELRRRVQLFQRECYDVLFKYFSGNNLTQSAGYERRSLDMVREARLLFGRRAGAHVWRNRGMPIVPEMEEAFKQLDLFFDDDDQAA